MQMRKWFSILAAGSLAVSLTFVAPTATSAQDKYQPNMGAYHGELDFPFNWKRYYTYEEWTGIMHEMQEELHFGGVGPSCMGAYHGFKGFQTFSHAKSVYRQAGVNVAKLGGMLPPYSKTTESTIKMQLKK